METVAELVSRPLPPLKKQNDRSYASEPESTDAASLRLFYQWENFPNEVLQACSLMDLSGLVPPADDLGDDFHTFLALEVWRLSVVWLEGW